MVISGKYWSYIVGRTYVFPLQDSPKNEGPVTMLSSPNFTPV
jgi:hypothetical protein